MRKYQQLILLLISCFSVGILLMYKSENNRLKYVLQVVNFFGRSDVAVLRRLDNGTKDDFIPDFEKPLAVWQQIGDNYHAYAAYWKRNELVAGGESHALVVGKTGAVINFRCNLIYDRFSKSVQGKFHFQRVINETLSSEKLNEFTFYNFYCRTTRDFGKQRLQPESVTFIDNTSKGIKTEHKLRLRALKPLGFQSSTAAISPSSSSQMQATICVDLVSFNGSSRYAKNDENYLQFFLTHQALGVEHFIVYNYDEIPSNVVKTLERINMHLHKLPFNFPFGITNTTIDRIRQFIWTDCLLRNINQARHTILLTPSEFFYASAKFANDRSLQHSLYQYPADVTQFELKTFAVCFDDSQKLLVDNKLYDPEIKTHKILLYRLNASSLNTQSLAQAQSTPLSLADGFVLQYVDCQQAGPDGLHDWRNSVREDFMKHISAIRNEVDLLI